MMSNKYGTVSAAIASVAVASAAIARGPVDPGDPAHANSCWSPADVPCCLILNINASYGIGCPGGLVCNPRIIPMASDVVPWATLVGPGQSGYDPADFPVLNATWPRCTFRQPKCDLTTPSPECSWFEDWIVLDCPQELDHRNVEGEPANCQQPIEN